MAFNGMIVTPYVVVLAGILGLVMGSFINCWAWRYLNGESVMKGRSHCTTCGHDLGVLDLIPIVSWLISKGKCRYCGEKVSIRYPLTELVTCIVFALITYVYGLSWETVELLAFASVLLFLTLTDIDAFLIPNGCIIAALVIRVVYLGYCFFRGSIDLYGILFYVGSALGMGLALLVVVLIADRFLKRPSMGGGDLKLYAVAGLYFGWQQGIYLVILSCFIGIFVGILHNSKRKAEPEEEEEEKEEEKAEEIDNMVLFKPELPQEPEEEEEEKVESPKEQSKPFPFGPSIAVACVITMLIGQPFVSWYLSLL